MMQQIITHTGQVMEVRQARLSDLSFVESIEQAVHHDPMSRALFEHELTVDVSHFWVACVDGEILGYAIFWCVAQELELHNIATSTTMQRQGVARALLGCVIETMRSRGATSMFLEVREHNLPAQNLYASLGFVERGRRKRYYKNPGEDALVMGYVF